jgi:hypothetical protein
MTRHVAGSLPIRTYEPRAFSFARPQFGVPALIKLPKATACLVYDADEIPGAMGWVECYGDRRLFTLCIACASTPDAELEQRLHNKLGLTSAEIAVAAE